MSVSSSSSSSSTAPSNDRLFQSALAFFESNFGHNAGLPLAVGVGPGRVNLIGEHTDYNDGFVFPLAIQRRTFVIARPNGLQRFRLASANTAAAQSTSSNAMEEEKASLPVASSSADGDAKRRRGVDGAKSAAVDTIEEFDLQSFLTPTPTTHAWHNYFRGVVAAYATAGLITPASLPFFDAAVCGDVPLGGGLSSSASLEMATAMMVELLCNLNNVSGVQRAVLCQSCEHIFAGVPCGIMDQFISSLAQQDHAMLIDCRSKEFRLYPLKDPSVTLLITNSNVKHQLSHGQYAVRRSQCEAAVAALKRRFPSISALRDANLPQLESVAREYQLDEKVFERGRHVITENDRTVRAAQCLEKSDWKMLGALMTQSHVSLKNDYEVSCSELDALVDIALGVEGVFGSRMTGGGFGGCTVTLVKTEALPRLIKAIEENYTMRSGLHATMLQTSAGAGASNFVYRFNSLPPRL